MQPNNRRFDLSGILIHFTRAIDLAADDDDDMPLELAREAVYGSIADEGKLSPFFLLREIVRRRQLLSTWSIRSGRPTIYGPHPAVCFTEMPIAAFVQASVARQKIKQKTSPYALLIPKQQAFAAGARPVIYGTSGSAKQDFDCEGVRRLEPAVFADEELYRYVAYNGTTERPDWTHEREWRWPNYAWRPPPYAAWEREVSGEDDEDRAYRAWVTTRAENALPEEGLILDGGYFDELGMLVRNRRQADTLTRDILTLVDQQEISPTLFRYVLDLPRLEALSDLHDPEVVDGVLQRNTLDLAPYFSPTVQTVAAFRGALNDIDRELRSARLAPDAHEGDGFSAPWLLDNTTSFCRAGIVLGSVTVSKAGRYLLRLPFIEAQHDVRAKQNLGKMVAQKLAERFQLRASYWTVIGPGKSQDDIPYYSGVDALDRYWWNRTDAPDDY